MAVVTGAITVGQALPSLVKDIPQRKIDMHSGVRRRSIHSDEAFARERGFRAPLAQGMMSTAYVSEMMTILLGAGIHQGRHDVDGLHHALLRGDRLTVHGVVKEIRSEGTVRRVVVEVWCENQDGEKTAVGTASRLLLEERP